MYIASVWMAQELSLTDWCYWWIDNVVCSPLQRNNFFTGLTVFLNGWLHATASEAVKCLTDLVKCMIYWLSCWLTSTYLATVWMTQELWNWLTLLPYWFFGSVVISFCWTTCGFWWLAVCLRSCWYSLTDLMKSLMTHWLTDNWLSDYSVSEWLRNFQSDWPYC